jgi:hypothetical protein
MGLPIKNFIEYCYLDKTSTNKKLGLVKFSNYALTVHFMQHKHFVQNYV